MYIESGGKSYESLANQIERGHLQLGELPLSIRNNVAQVLEKREAERKAKDAKSKKAAAKVQGESGVKAKAAAKPKAKAKAKK